MASKEFSDKTEKGKFKQESTQINKLEFEQFLLHQLMEKIPDIIYFKDTESRFIKVSESFAQKHGMKSTNEAVGKTDFDIFSKEHAQKAYNDEQRIIKTGEPLQNIEEKETRGDKVSWASTTKLPLQNQDGDTIGTFGITRDITQKKRAEQALIKNEAKLQKLNATKDKFFSIIAHDLKNPFNAIIGYSKLAKDFLQKKDYDKAEEFIQIVSESSDKAMELLENLLEWSRSQRGKIPFEPKEFKVVPLVNNVLALFKASLSEKKLTAENLIAPETLINADEYMFKTIMRNLISNAVKYTEPGGSIQIQAKHKGDKTEFSVRDNGRGIKDKDPSSLFEIESGTPDTSGQTGTGLGLILCKEFTDAHGGKISIESQESRGTTVRFEI